MDILVDTSAWSIALRRNRRQLLSQDESIVNELRELTAQGRVVLVGAIRQEILSGIKHTEQFLKLRNFLKPFPDLSISTEHHELAAHCYNKCKKRGIQGSNTDFLICAVALSFSLTILTLDHDFKLFQKVFPIKLYK